MNAPETPGSRATHDTVGTCIERLEQLEQNMRAAGCEFDVTHVHPSYQQSAENLLGYLALRQHDIRPLQAQLAELGLSSLGRCEQQALGSVEKVLAVLKCLSGSAAPEHFEPFSQSSWSAAQASLLQEHSLALFADAPRGRAVQIMVTMPSEAADDYDLVEQLLAAGMNCQRINCAHDGPETWLKMIRHLRAASKKLGLPCQVAMDLAGPKLRTGPIASRDPVLKLRPQRDAFGTVLAPARAYLCTQPVEGVDWVSVPEKWLKTLVACDVIKMTDARGSRRELNVMEVDKGGCWVELFKTAYIVPGSTLSLKNPHGRKSSAKVMAVPAVPCSIVLKEGELLTVVLGDTAGRPAQLDADGNVVSAAQITCDAAAVFQAAEGDPIWFDDGKIGGVVMSSAADTLSIKVTHAPDGTKLKAEKGINLPSTDLDVEALSEDDLKALAFAAEHADIVQMSFVNQAEDVRVLLRHLQRLGAQRLGVVLKIENRRGFENLPALLLAGMATPRLGVMIARGDLAVETGFERTAELQEEMLCLCEAAHVPVIWATQVLESLAKDGAPTRAEISDAAMGARAECVMLNKGPHILKAISTLDDILKRMQEHRDKKRDMMRKLSVARIPLEAATPDGSAIVPSGQGSSSACESTAPALREITP
jgi:pyruvate kinase